MMRKPSYRGRRLAVALGAVLALASVARVPAATGAGDPAAALRARHAALSERLEHSSFQQRLYLESAESSHSLQGDIWAVVDYPVAAVTAALASPAHWCDALILHLNVKYCHPVARGAGTALSVAIGRKYDQPLGEAFRLALNCRVVATGPEYSAVELESAKGPFGTTDYRISLEAVAVAPARSFVHLRYAYQYGLEARLAMDAYLATSGSGKVGFTRIDDPGERAPRYIAGVRGVIERNTMRYFLAIDAYLDTVAAPAPQRLERSLERWYSATERYARQLHEVDRDAYLTMKRREYLRQQTLL
jgi:hypothetical protein